MNYPKEGKILPKRRRYYPKEEIRTLKNKAACFFVSTIIQSNNHREE